MRRLVFVVESESGICQLVEHSLEPAGFMVRTFSTANIMAEAEQTPPALIMVALMLCDGNGLDLCRQIREHPMLGRTPVVFLISEGAEEHRVLALNSGGDDCIVKPFSPRELLARVQAVLRRLVSPPLPTSRTEPADLIIDSSAMKLSVRGTEVPTTSLEFRLIEYLARHRGQVFTRDLLLDAVWGDTQFVTPRSVDACIRRIREKIEPDRETPTYLKTVRGFGYRLDAVAAWQLTSSEGCTCVVCTSPATSSKLISAGVSRRKKSIPYK